jgi:hypothetical protein
LKTDKRRLKKKATHARPHKAVTADMGREVGDMNEFQAGHSLLFLLGSPCMR